MGSREAAGTGLHCKDGGNVCREVAGSDSFAAGSQSDLSLGAKVTPERAQRSRRPGHRKNSSGGSMELTSRQRERQDGKAPITDCVGACKNER